MVLVSPPQTFPALTFPHLPIVYELVVVGLVVSGQIHPFSRSAKTEIQLHTQHHATNRQYYFRILTGQPLTNPIQMVVLHPNLTRQISQIVLELTALLTNRPIYPTPEAWLSRPSMWVLRPMFPQEKRRRHWPPMGGPATKPTVLVPAEWLPLAVGTFTSCSSTILPSFSKQMWPVTTPWLSVPSLRPV
jgi:hypothetical protein